MAESMNFPTVWWDGKLTPWEQATIHITQMGPASVSSVFEGIRAYQNPNTNDLAVFRAGRGPQALFAIYPAHSS